MAQIRSYWFVRHLRAEQNTHVLLFKNGRMLESGRGLSFWFLPMSASIAEIPIDDRDQNFLFHGRSADHQDITVQGTVAWRVADALQLSQRVDFTVDLETGRYIREPLEQVSGLLTNLSQRFAEAFTAPAPVRRLLEAGTSPLRDSITSGLKAHPALAEMGIEVVAVHIASISPTSELERALQTPAREAFQQSADEATFNRRAQAVENERAIAENELQNRIELARREQLLIDQKGLNQRRQAEETAAAGLIKTQGLADNRRISAEGERDSIVLLERAKVDAEQARMDIYKELPQSVMLGLAAQELAGNLTSIDHLNVSPELLAPMLANLVEAGTRKLER